jgi:adenosine deaminase
MLAGVVRAIDDARAQFGIEARIVITCVRHFGEAACINVAKQATQSIHPYVVGFGMGGDEINYPNKMIKRAFEIAAEAGLKCTTHAGEFRGAEEVRDAIRYLPVSRIGHGVRAIEDPDVVAEVIDKGITLECCLQSNISLGVFPDFPSHSFKRLMDAGVKVTLNTDDPPFFGAAMEKEFALAKKYFNLSDQDLLRVTKTAIQNSFADEVTKTRLLKKIPVLNG